MSDEAGLASHVARLQAEEAEQQRRWAETADKARSEARQLLTEYVELRSRRGAAGEILVGELVAVYEPARMFGLFGPGRFSHLEWRPSGQTIAGWLVREPIACDEYGIPETLGTGSLGMVVDTSARLWLFKLGTLSAHPLGRPSVVASANQIDKAFEVTEFAWSGEGWLRAGGHPSAGVGVSALKEALAKSLMAS